MNSSSQPQVGTDCATNPFASGLHSQSSQSHLKRFIMFDHSGGKGRVFFHPVLLEELLGSSQAQECDVKGFSMEKESNIKFVAYRQMIEGAFTSLQTLRGSRQSNMASMQLPKETSLLPGALASSQKSRVFESTAGGGTSWAVADKILAQKCMASTTLVCEEKAKVSAILPSTESLRDCKMAAQLLCSSYLSGTKSSDVAVASESMRENTEDLDALLCSDEDEDEDVRSTGHSPDESLCKGDVFGKDEDEEVEQRSCKRRKVGIDYQDVMGPCGASAGNEMNDKASVMLNCRVIQSSRRQKIKKTVKALRKMLPGGSLLDAALVLDETITYVKTLQDRVNQLEATRFQ